MFIYLIFYISNKDDFTNYRCTGVKIMAPKLDKIFTKVSGLTFCPCNIKVTFRPECVATFYLNFWFYSLMST